MTYRKISLKIIIIYVSISLLWILLADTYLYQYFQDGKIISILKGVVYVAFSVLLLLYLMKQSWKSQQDLLIKEYEDDLTGLPNRSSLQKTLENFIYNKEVFHLLFVDFDRFKMINDLYGHDSGDFALMQISERLHNNNYLTSSDMVARWGADEFIVLIKNRLYDDIEKFVESILTESTIPLSINGKEISISISIGSVQCPIDTVNSTELLRFAELAADEAKKAGGLRHVRYHKELSELANKELYLVEGLHNALEKGELFLNFQPQIETETHDIIGVETLIRWKLENKFISPAEFIPIAEKTGHIIQIGDFVLRETCKNIPLIEKEIGKELLYSINVSARQFYQKDYIQRTKKILEETNVLPSKIVLEITESIIMEYTDFVLKSLQELKEFGFQIAIDDFGTGYSSFKYLELLPVNIIKIDQSFTQAIHRSRTKAIVQSIISLGHNLDLKILAEGVEDLFQVANLNELNCHYLQGYFFSKPLTLENLLMEYKK
ncbi:putative bifunctional diguanylate cyclase/phosphodiesterase [Psychrobacillus vulpis]|nr:bifunctional diguanylate cyclase/phosphodiesterase [Psychrobacillus vulpis]